MEKNMTQPSDGIELTLFSKPQLLITELAEEFTALNADLMKDIKPRGTIERIYVDDIAALVWEIRRLRRCKVAIVNTAFKNALSHTVYRLAGSQKWYPEKEWDKAVVLDWFSKPKARKEVLKLLADFASMSLLSRPKRSKRVFGARGAGQDADIAGFAPQQGASLDCGLPKRLCKAGAGGQTGSLKRTQLFSWKIRRLEDRVDHGNRAPDRSEPT